PRTRPPPSSRSPPRADAPADRGAPGAGAPPPAPGAPRPRPAHRPPPGRLHVSTSAAATSSPQKQADPPAAPKARTAKRPGDLIFSGLSIGSGLLIFLTLALVAVFLTIRSVPAIQASREVTGDPEAISLVEFTGPLVFGTVLAAVLALIMAVPVAVGIALFISHFAPRRAATPLGFMIDLLAA